MAVIHTLAAIGRFIRRAPPPPADLLEAYAHEVIPVLDRAEWLYQYWLEQSTLFTDSEKLGNVAAIHRWETATMGRSLERVIPPSVLADAHARVLDALEMASRAAQLLSNGSRFHNANAVCEGHAMLGVSRERRLAALRSMRRYLERIQPAVSPEAEAAAALAEAVALTARPADASPSDLPPVDSIVEDAPVGTGSGSATGDAVQSADASAPVAETHWPELAELDLILTDESEPEPVWLSAARSNPPAADVPTIEPPERAPSVPAARDTAPAPVDGPVLTPDAADSVDTPTVETGPVTTPPATPLPPESTVPPPETTDPKTAARTPDPQPETPVSRPSPSSGWGSLFGKPRDQPRD